MRWPWSKRRRVAVEIGGRIPVEPNLPPGSMPTGIELTDNDSGKVYPMVPVFQGEDDGTTYWAAVLHPDVDGEVILARGHFDLVIEGRPERAAVVVAFQQFVRVVRHGEVQQVS